MLYKYNKNSVSFEEITNKVVLGCLFLVFLFTFFAAGIILIEVNNGKLLTQETKAIIINEATKANEFSPTKLKTYILELNLRFPHIVYAQARLETGNFKSEIFKTNHNLFGLKQATRRPTTNKGTENGHAYFNTWRESVVDYAFYSSAYLQDIKTEREYLEYLKANYAEAPNYITELEKIINEEKLK